MANDVRRLISERSESIRKIFGTFDADRDGLISQSEFIKSLQRLKIHGSEKDLRELHASVSSNQQMGLDFDDFVFHFAPGGNDTLPRVRAKLMPQDTMMDATFMQFDTDRNKIISHSEFRQGMETLQVRLTSGEVETLMRIFDSSDKGGMDIAEFKQHFGPRKIQTMGLKLGAKDKDLLAEVKKEMAQAFRGYKINLVQAFDAFDDDGDGKISLLDFGNGLTQLEIKHKGQALNQKQVENLHQLMGRDKQGFISWRNFRNQFTSGTMTTGDIFAEMRMILRQHKANLATFFEAFDTDGTGTINKHDFAAGLRELQIKDISNEQIDKCVRHMDSDGSGRIAYNDFVKAMSGNTQPSAGSHTFPVDAIAKLRDVADGEDFEEIFMSFRPARAGKLTRTEFARGLSNLRIKLTKQEEMDIFRYMDQDGDGHIDFREFSRVIKRNVQDRYQAGLSQISRERVSMHHNSSAMSESAMSRANILRMQQKFRDHNVNVEQAFQAFDRDRNGMVSPDEFRQGMRAMDLDFTRAEVDALIKHFDPTGHGQISAKEFAKVFNYSRLMSKREIAILQQKFRDHGRSLKREFATFDEFGNGTITAGEFRKVIRGMGITLSRVEVESIIRHFDSAESGRISYREFVDDFGSEAIGSSFRMSSENIERMQRKFRDHNVNLREAFETFDVNDDGFISPAEFQRGLRALGMDMLDSEIMEMIQHFDSSGRGKISRRDFEREFEYSGLSPRRSPSHHQHRMSPDNIRRMQEKFRDHGVDLKEAFEAFDDNGDGVISPAEFRRGIRAMGMNLLDSEVEDMIRHIDASGRSRISRRDFESEFGHGHLSPRRSPRHGRSSDYRMSTEAIRRIQGKFRDHGVNLTEAFEAFDDNGDGVISPAEFRRGIRAMSMNLLDSEVEDMIRHIDASGRGRISRRDFESEFGYGHLSPRRSPRHGRSSGYRMSTEAIRRMQEKFRDHGVNLTEAFEAFDDNGDGVISPAEFRRGIRAMSMNLLDSEVEDMIRHFDSSGRGQISRHDFESEFDYGNLSPRRSSHRMSTEAIRRLQEKFRDHGVNLKEAFEAFDDNGDGVISPDEFRRGIRAIGMNLLESEVEDMIRHIDASGRGRISRRDFESEFGYSSLAYRMSNDNIRRMQEKFRNHGANLEEAFEAFDDNGDGVISPVEFRRGIRAMGMNLLESEVEDMIRHFDTSGTGQITLRDFISEFSYAGGGRLSHQSRAARKARIWRNLAYLSSDLRRTLSVNRDTLRRGFQAFQQDRDGLASWGAVGVISHSEFVDAIRTMSIRGVAVSDIREIARAVDTDGNGVLDWHEFVRYFGGEGESATTRIPQNLRRRIARKRVQLTAEMERYDGADGADGVIVGANLRRALEERSELSYSEVAELMRSLDIDDGAYVDYRCLMRGCGGWSPHFVSSVGEATMEELGLLGLELEVAMDRLDPTGDGLTSYRTFQSVLLSLSTDLCVERRERIARPFGNFGTVDSGALSACACVCVYAFSSAALMIGTAGRLRNSIRSGAPSMSRSRATLMPCSS
eukprot:SAG11_NODE_65_length_18798_cov_11.881224_7_plen_1529_part_00